MRKLSIGLLLIAVLTLWGCSKKEGSTAGTTGASGQAAPKAAGDYSAMVAAVQTANSWKMKSVIPPTAITGVNATQPEVMEIHVTCPDRSAMILGKPGAQMRTISIGDQTWGSMDGSPGGPWMRMKTEKKGKGPCGAETIAFLVEGLLTASPRKGAAANVNGTACQEWIASGTDEKGRSGEYTICVGSDNLPVQLKHPDGTVTTYSDWNRTVVEKPPNAG